MKVRRRSSSSVVLPILSGIYSRVARNLGVHPSYVSRVARGERRSERIYQAVVAEIASLRGAALEEQAVIDSELRNSNTAALKDRKDRLAMKFKSNPRIRKLRTVIIDVEDPQYRSRSAHSRPQRISRKELAHRIASQSLLIAAVTSRFERASRKLEHIPHVLSLVDADGIVLYSFGNASMVRLQGGTPGSDWSSNSYRGLSASAHALDHGVPIVILDKSDAQLGSIRAVRMACPIRLANNETAAAIVLTIGIQHATSDHFVSLCRMAKHICTDVERSLTSRSTRLKHRV